LEKARKPMRGSSLSESLIEFRSAKSVLSPRSVALVGASERGRWPRDIYMSSSELGFEGPFYLINPKQTEIYGKPAYPSLRDTPGPVEHAIIIVPAPAVMDVLADAHASGVKSATIYAGGMGDGDSPASIERGEHLRSFIARTGMRIAGPNCMGAFSFREKLFAYPNRLVSAMPGGSVACVFQSGGTLQFFMRTGGIRGLRFSYGISSGNEIDLDLADYLNYLVDDEATLQIVLFIEGIRRPDAFMAAAGRALVSGKTVLAIKTGATIASASAAASHTGAIAGDYQSYLAMCDRYGIVNCQTLDDLVETALAFQNGRKPKGPRVGWVTTSGGTVDLLYDYVEAQKTPLGAFTQETTEKLKPYMQEGINPKNPLDSGIPSTIKNAADQCAIVAADPNIDMVVWANQLPARSDMWVGQECLRAMRDATDKPVLGCSRMSYQLGPDALDVQARAGITFLQRLPETCRALNALWFHAERAGKAPAIPPIAGPSDLHPSNLDAKLAEFQLYGPRSRVAADARSAADAAAHEIGFPVVLKVRSPDISHKTEANGVALDLRSQADVLAAAQAIAASAQAAVPGAKIEGYLVQKMAQGVEVAIGVHEDPLYGPVLLIGAGGVLVELMHDVEVILLPTSTEEIESRLSRLKLDKLLTGFRGRPNADRDALIQATLSLGQFYLNHRAAIAGIEINPLMVAQKSAGVCAVDVRVVWRDQNSQNQTPKGKP
jgi:acetyltransferase